MLPAPLNVALESHSVEKLISLLPILPQELAGQLAPYVDKPPTSSPMPYSLVFNISRWTRTPEGRAALANASPSLPATDYEMIALLAGARTSPEKHFPLPPGGGWDARQRELTREKGDRRAVANIVNALVSIVGCAVAVWYAAGSVGWRDEWVRLVGCVRYPALTRSGIQRVLLALLAAAVVGTAESVLYIIWTSGPSSTRRKTPRTRGKRDEDAGQSPRDDATSAPPSQAGEGDGRDALRQRRVAGVQDVT